jgi:PAS domain S-box-containing protein
VPFPEPERDVISNERTDEPSSTLPEDGSATLTELLDGVPSAIAFWDRELRNVFANRAYIDWFGMTPEELRGQHARAMLGPELFELNLPFMQKALAGEPQVFERVLRTPAGESRHAQIDYSPFVFDDEIIGFITTVVDVSERIRAERAARKVAEQLATLAERHRIEERAHEGVLQDLFAVQLWIDRARASIATGSPAAGALESALERLDAAVADLRLVIGDDVGAARVDSAAEAATASRA